MSATHDEQHRRLNEDEYERPSKIIDAKMPLTWLLSSAAAIIVTVASMVWSMANMSNKLDQLIAANIENKALGVQRDARVDGLNDKIYTIQRDLDSIKNKVEELQRDRFKASK